MDLLLRQLLQRTVSRRQTFEFPFIELNFISFLALNSKFLIKILYKRNSWMILQGLTPGKKLKEKKKKKKMQN